MSPRNSSGTMVPANGPYIVNTTADPTIVNARFADIEAEIGSSLDRTGRGGMLAPVRGADGTVAAPAYSFTSEVGTGAYRAGASDYRISLAGVDRVFIGANGLGIGAAPGVVGGGTLTLSASGHPVIDFVETSGVAGNMRGALVYDSGVALGAPGWVFQSTTDAGAFISNAVIVQRDGLVRLLNTTAIQPASMVTAITPNTGWTNNSGGYWKDSNGIVHLRGLVTFNSGANPLTTLPAGFRPANTRYFGSAYGPTATQTVISVDQFGVVNLTAVNGGVSTTGTLDAASFLAEQ